MRRLGGIGTLLIGMLAVLPAMAQQLPLSPNGVKTLAPDGAIKSTGTWNLGTRAGDFVYIAGMRGIDPKTRLPGPDGRPVALVEAAPVGELF